MKTTLLAFFAITFLSAAQTDAPVALDAKTREARWYEDLDVYAKELPSRHKDFYRLISRQQFAGQVAELKQAVPTETDAEIILRLMRLTASLGVSHTRIDWPTGISAFQRYPLRLEWFSDELVVTAATSDNRAAVGGRVLRIGSHTPAQVESAVASLVSHDNAAGLRSESPAFIEKAAILQSLKIAETDGRIRLQLSKPDRQIVTLGFAPASAQHLTNWVGLQDAFSLPTVLARSRPREFYWFDYLTNARTLYVQYSVCMQAPNRPFTHFAAALFAFAEAHPIQRVVVDLRYNGGGDSEVVKPLLKGLDSRPALSARGKLYTLIGRDTASSGMMAALELRDALHATLVGEPTSGKPNAYGDVRTFQLPHSHLVVRYATKYFRLVKRGDPPSVNPDLRVSQSLDDLLAGRDPVLEAALAQPQSALRRDTLCTPNGPEAP